MKTLALDADDTLWENIDFFLEAQDGLCELLKDFATKQTVESELFKKELQNVPLYGYGTKSFVLSMVELAIELTDGQLPSSTVLKIHDLGRHILQHPFRLLQGVEQTIPILAKKYRLVIATKGDLFEQEQKLERSGLKPYIQFMQVMPNKRPENYRQLMNLLNVEPQDFIMVGNTLKSDVIPVLELGGTGVFIPYHYTWEHESVPEEISRKYKFIQLEHFGQLVEYGL